MNQVWKREWQRCPVVIRWEEIRWFTTFNRKSRSTNAKSDVHIAKLIGTLMSVKKLECLLDKKGIDFIKGSCEIGLNPISKNAPNVQLPYSRLRKEVIDCLVIFVKF